MSKTDFVVLGFPKCGTSALMRLFEGIDGVVVGREKGALEASFYLSDENCRRYLADPDIDPSKINGHKYASYIYGPSAVRRIAEHHPQALHIVCIRDPARSLMSWREMHRDIAVRGKQPNHFAYKDPVKRKFYAEASLEDYYKTFVKDRLQYESHLRKVLGLIGASRLVIVDQALLAAAPQRVESFFRSAFGLPDHAAAGTEPTREAPYLGYADKFSLGDVPDTLRATIDHERRQLETLLHELSESGAARVLR